MGEGREEMRDQEIGEKGWGRGAAAGWAVSADDYFLTAWVDMPGQIRPVSEMV